MAFGDFTVVRSTVKNVLGSNGLIGQVAIDTPAFEFNADGTYRGLLVEPGATNLALYSQEFDNAYWVKTNTTAAGNATISPDGTLNADRLTSNAVTGIITVDSSGISVTAGTHSLSAYIKSDGWRWVQLRTSGLLGLGFVNFDIIDGVKGTESAATGTIEPYGDGWFRVSISATLLTASGGIAYNLVSSGTSVRAESATGDGTSGIFIWQAQLETGSVATSPIPTVASTVTRTADDISLASASSLIGQTEGTVYIEAEYIPDGTGRALLNLSASGDDTTRTNNRFVLGAIPSNQFEFRTVVGGVNQCEIISGARTASILKLAVTYAVNDFAFYINGSSIGTDTLGTVPTCANIYLGANILNAAQYRGWIRSVALFPTRLANATLESITTL
jgi:hypothetical protein